jgi:hypothetical protein
MRPILYLTVHYLLLSGPPLSATPPPADLARDSPVNANQGEGWILETAGNATFLRFQPPKEGNFGFETQTADLFSAISAARSNSPFPLKKIVFGAYLVHCRSLQNHLFRELESRHPLSMIHALGENNSIPVQGVESAPPLPPLALAVLKSSPHLKLIEEAASSSGYRIKDVTWDSFQATESVTAILFQGHVIIHLESR